MKNNKLILNTIVIASIGYVLYSMGQLSIPFIVGIILAYAFSSPTKYMTEKIHLSRSAAAGIIVLFLVSVFALFVIFLVPLLKNAVMTLVEKFPEFVKNIPEYLESSMRAIGVPENIKINENLVTEYTKGLAITLPSFFTGFLNTSVTLLYSVLFVVMTPIITFYLIKDWDKISSYISRFLEKHKKEGLTIKVLSEIHHNLAAYIIGQLTICCLLSIFYVVGLYFVGVKQFVACGIFSGLLSFAPFFGPFLGLLTTLSISIENFSSIYQYIATISIYLIVPFLDSNFITPRLIGKQTGIQPFWILFSICATVSIMGMGGIIISVPIAVILSTISREVIKKI